MFASGPICPQDRCYWFGAGASGSAGAGCVGVGAGCAGAVGLRRRRSRARRCGRRRGRGRRRRRGQRVGSCCRRRRGRWAALSWPCSRRWGGRRLNGSRVLLFLEFALELGRRPGLFGVEAGHEDAGGEEHRRQAHGRPDENVRRAASRDQAARAAAAHAKRAAFGSLQQDCEHQRNAGDQMDDEQDVLHGKMRPGTEEWTASKHVAGRGQAPVRLFIIWVVFGRAHRHPGQSQGNRPLSGSRRRPGPHRPRAHASARRRCPV